MERKIQEADYPNLIMMEIERESSQNVLSPKIPKWTQSLVQNYQLDNIRNLTRS